MSNAQATALQSIYAALRYRDCPAAIAWLKTALGFEENVVYPNDDGTIAHAQLQFGGNLIMLGSFPGGPSGTSLPELGDAFGAGIYIALDTPAEVDAAFERAKAAGAKIIEVNLEKTPLSSSVDYSFTGPSGVMLPQLLDR